MLAICGSILTFLLFEGELFNRGEKFVALMAMASGLMMATHVMVTTNMFTQKVEIAVGVNPDIFMGVSFAAMIVIWAYMRVRRRINAAPNGDVDQKA